MRSKVVDSARDLGLELTPRLVPEARGSADAAAAALGCGAARICACSVYVADGDPVVCVAPAACTVDSDLLAEALDVAEVRPASDGEIRAATGFSATGVPPIGHGLPVVVDAAVVGHETVWAPAGDGRTLVELAPERLATCTSATVAAVTAERG